MSKYVQETIRTHFYSNGVLFSNYCYIDSIGGGGGGGVEFVGGVLIKLLKIKIKLKLWVGNQTKKRGEQTK